ncbi:MAG: hypothetical protein H6706_08490 [Myxococcales bacterium]|nr:hypothetical protein [Myxococcales bacterium]
MRWWMIVGLALLVGCGDGGDESEVDAAAGDATVADQGMVDAGPPAGDGLPPGCSEADPAACLYLPAARYEHQVQTFEDLTYTDVIGAERTVRIAVYRPQGAPTPMPVVLLSHGGSGGSVRPLNSLEDWAARLAAAGYLAVGIAHEGRDEASYAAVCAALNVPVVAGFQCGIKVHWDRPPDVGRVIDWLEAQAAGGPLDGQVDLTRIAHLGHSAGGGAATMVAGATRSFVCAQPYGMDQGSLVPCDEADLVSAREPRLKAVVAMSPQGPGTEGFLDASFASVGVPMLMATGAADGDPGEPATRSAIFDNLPTSADGQGFLRLYLDDPGAKHTLFAGSVDACTPIAGAERCQTMRSWVFSLGLAFLDRELRGSAEAAAWLASEAIVIAGGGTSSLSRR